LVNNISRWFLFSIVCAFATFSARGGIFDIGGFDGFKDKKGTQSLANA
jgi:hypothetical protein